MFTPIKREPSGFVNEMASPRTPQSTSLSRELKQVLRERNLFTAKTRDKVCHMLSDSPTNTPFGKKSIQNPEANKLKEFRLQAVQEIVSSERSYLSQLEILMKYFVIPIKEKQLIDVHTHSIIFGQIEMIYNLNQEFLRQLENNVENVAPAFLKMAPFFKIYSVFAFDYRNALIKLQDCYSHKTLFRKYIEETESRPEVQRKLNSLMIIPIQRVPRYRLLLEQLLLYTSPAEPDFKILKESVKLIENTISHINSCVEDQEITQFLINIQNSLINRMPNIVKPSRKVIKEGILNKVNRKGTEDKRYCILMSDIFMYCKIHKERSSNTVVENSLECCCIFPLKKCKVYELFPGTFKVTCQGDGAIFSTNDLHLSNTWTAFIRDAIDMHVQCRKTLRKESSKRKPLRKKDLKNFENDYVISPSKRRCDFETVYRTITESDEEHDTHKSFLRHTFTKLSGINFLGRDSKGPVKRKSTCLFDNSESNTKQPYSSPHPPKSGKANLSKIYRKSRCMFKRPISNGSGSQPSNDLFPNHTQSSNEAEARTLSQTHAQLNNNDPENAYGFASRFSDTTSYFRTHNVDNTIPTASNMQDILKETGLSEGSFRDCLYPLRLSGGKGGRSSPDEMRYSNESPSNPFKPMDKKYCSKVYAAANKNYNPNAWVFQPRESSDFTLPLPKKRVKFEGIPDDQHITFGHNIQMRKEDILSRPFAFGHDETRHPPKPSASLSEKLTKFFTNLWSTAFK